MSWPPPLRDRWVVDACGSLPVPASQGSNTVLVPGKQGTAGAAVLAAAASQSPAEPGVYLFLDEAHDVLYVGKATNLRSRLRQHANVGPPTSPLHQRYELVRRVVWDVTENEKAASWREADLIFALQPPFNANPGLRSRDPLGGPARFPFLVVTEGRDATLRFALDPDPSTADAVYGCFPHLGKGMASQLGIACSDGYVALLRLLWAASGEGTNCPTAITKSAPTTFDVSVAEDVRPGLHRLLSGVSAKVVAALAAAAGSRPAFMQPALARDREASLQFFAAAPQLVRGRRLHHAIKATPVTADLYRQLVIDEIELTIAGRAS